jgi:hypothetical protein
MADSTSPRETLRPLRRARQVREFTDEPLTDAQLEAITDVARWTGSSRNSQPWRFLEIRDPGTIRRLEAVGLPQTRSLKTATAVVAIVLPDDDERRISRAYDDGRAAERMLIAAGMIGAAAGIAWSAPTSCPPSARSSACRRTGWCGPSWRSGTRPSLPGSQSPLPARRGCHGRHRSSKSAFRGTDYFGGRLSA